MNLKYEECRENLSQLIQQWEQYEAKRNEATTRFHLIDTLFLSCLGWDKLDITTEDHHNKEYTDYIFRLVRPVFILEAKREGNFFVLPEGTKGIEYSLSSLCKDNPGFKKAIEQVTNYCQDRGIEIGMVCNGWQLVAFVANRADGIPPLEGEAIVYPTLQAMHGDFLTFWNLFSKASFEKKNLRTRLLGQILPELPPKLSTLIKPYPGIKGRNDFQINMQAMADLILEDVMRYDDLEEKFLEECYCTAGALSHYSSVSKDILKTRYEYLFEKNANPLNVTPVSDKKGLAPEFKDVAAQSVSRRPILLIGDVGVGKTSFIENLINIEGKQVFESCLTFKINLGTQIVLALDIRTAIIDAIIRQLENQYSIDVFENNFVKGVYNLEFEKFKKGIYKPYFDSDSEKAIEKSIEFFEDKIKDKSEHLRKSLLHIAKGHRKQIVIFIDNCDQRDYNTQQTAFLIAQEFAEHWQPVTVFVSLRPETFHSSLRKGALSGYHPKAFTIAPPRVDLVIQKRLLFAKKIANGQIPVARLGGNVDLNSIDKLLDVMIDSFDRNDSLYTFVENICAGNVRIALDIVRNFFGSGHVNTQKMLSTSSYSGDYTVSLHEFIKAVVLGENVYYEPENSFIYNLFDVHYIDEKEHFLSLILINSLQIKMDTGKDNGYLETVKASSHLQALGFTIDQIDTCMNVLIRKNLVETSAKGSAFDVNVLPQAMRITPTGAYHLNVLVGLFSYFDNMIVDTPIFNIEIRASIQDVDMIHERLKRAMHFLNYLDDIWARSFKNAKSLFDWEAVSRNLKIEMRKIESKLTFQG